MRRNFVCSVWDGVLATPFIYYFQPSNFILAALITQYFGVSKTLYGLIIATSFWSNLFQLFVIPALERRFRHRNIALTAAWCQITFWAGLCIAMPLLPTDDPDRVGKLLVAFFGLSNLSSSVLWVGWQSWCQWWIPKRVRGPFLGKRRFFTELATAGFLLAATVIFAGSRAESISVYQGVLAVAVIMRVGCILFQHQIRDAQPHPKAESLPLRAALRQGVSGNIRLYIVFVFFVTLWAYTTSPFQNIFLLEEIGVDVSGLGGFSFVEILAGAAVAPLWGRLTAKYGAATIAIVCIVARESELFVWVSLTEETAWALWGMKTWGGVFHVGYLISTYTLLLNLLPEKNAGAAVAVKTAALCIAGGISPAISGFLLDQGAAIGWEQTSIYRAAFILRPLAIFAAVPLLWKLREHRL